MKQRDKELKKKRKAKRKPEVDDSETGSNQLEQNNNQKSFNPIDMEAPEADPTGNPDLGIVFYHVGGDILR